MLCCYITRLKYVTSNNFIFILKCCFVHQMCDTNRQIVPAKNTPKIHIIPTKGKKICGFVTVNKNRFFYYYYYRGKLPITVNGIQSLLQTISHAKCYEELLVKGWYSFFVDRPVQDAAWTQHASTEEECTG